MSFHFSSKAAAAYGRMAVESGNTASSHTLVKMLFDGLEQALNASRGAIERGDIEEKGRQLGKAVRILEEGLKAGINLEKGGELAENLYKLYEYCIVELTKANARNDEKLVQVVADILKPVMTGWSDIKDHPEVLNFSY